MGDEVPLQSTNGGGSETVSSEITWYLNLFLRQTEQAIMKRSRSKTRRSGDAYQDFQSVTQTLRLQPVVV